MATKYETNSTVEFTVIYLILKESFYFELITLMLARSVWIILFFV